jgi:enamine deaminase RidA (YjgF/YER057c/UK114 family)
MDVLERLRELNLTLPPVAKPVAAYVPTMTAGDLVYVSGQLPLVEGRLTCQGAVPSAVSVEQAQLAARQCALNGLAALGEAIGGDWSRLRQVVRIGVFVACEADFTDQPKVANGASELLAAVLGDRGRHARAAVGAPALPLGATVEVEMIAQIRP